MWNIYYACSRKSSLRKTTYLPIECRLHIDTPYTTILPMAPPMQLQTQRRK